MSLATPLVPDPTRVRAAAELSTHWPAMLQVSPLLLCVLDGAGRITEASQAWLQRIGRRVEAVLGCRPADFMTGDSANDLQRFSGPTGVLGSLRDHPCDWSRPDGGVLSLHLTTLAQRDERGRPTSILCVFEDFTERRELAHRLEQASRSDSLTGAWNRAWFTELMRLQMNQGREDGPPACLLLMQAEHFRELNDTCGHSVGDAALCSIVATLRRLVREGDCIGRLSGASFAVLMPRAGLEAAHPLVERVRRALGDLEIRHSGYQRRVEARYALIELQPDDSPESALARAEHAVSGRRRASGAQRPSP